jgi:hypothetical protein
MSLQLLENKALSRGIIGKSAPLLAEITIRKSQDQSLQSSVRDHVQTVNRQVLDAFNSCIEADGLHVWLERTYDPKVFKFVARFNSPNPRSNPVATVEMYSPGANVACEEHPATISRSIWRTRCTRQNDAPVDFIVRADSNPLGGGNLVLPAISSPLIIQRVVLCTMGLPEDCTQPLGRIIVAGCPSKAEGERPDPSGKISPMPVGGWISFIPVEENPKSKKVVGTRLLKSSVVRGSDASLIVQPPQPHGDGKSIRIQCYADKDSVKATVHLDIGVDLQ